MNENRLCRIFGKRTDLYILSGFFLLNLIWKLLSVNVVPVDHDEPFSIFYSQMDIPAMYKYFAGKENNTLFFECILHYWTKIFGLSTIAVRMPAILFSSATVIFIYKICRNNYNLSTAIIASILFTFSNYHLGFSHEARTYAMFAFFVSTSMYVFLEFVKKPAKKNLWVLSICNIPLLYTHFFALFIPFVQFLCCVFRKDLRTRIFGKYIQTCIITGIAYLPMFFLLLNRFTHSINGSWLGPTDFDGIFNILLAFTNDLKFFWMATLVFLAAILLFLMKKEKKIQQSCPK